MSEYVCVEPHNPSTLPHVSHSIVARTLVRIRTYATALPLSCPCTRATGGLTRPAMYLDSDARAALYFTYTHAPPNAHRGPPPREGAPASLAHLYDHHRSHARPCAAREATCADFGAHAHRAQRTRTKRSEFDAK